ncbi:hypothetical protein Mgra_00000099, partial [Meloidogyne graminicola]
FNNQQKLIPYSFNGRSSFPFSSSYSSSSFIYPPMNNYFGSNGYGTNFGNYYQPYRKINKPIDCNPSFPINNLPNNGQQFGTGGIRTNLYPPYYYGGTIDFGGNSKQQNGINNNNNLFPSYYYKTFYGEGENQNQLPVSQNIHWQPIQRKE